MILLVALLLLAASASTAMAEEAGGITGKYFELELKRFPDPSQDRFYVQFGTVSTAWPRTLAIAPQAGEYSFFHIKIANHQLHVVNSTHTAKIPLPKKVNLELEYRFEGRDRGRGTWWIVARVISYMNATPSRTLVYEAWVEIPQHTKIRVFSSHEVALVVVGNWSITYYDYSHRQPPPVAKTPGARPQPPRQPEFTGACQAMLDIPEPRISPGFVSELIGWFGSIASCVVTAATSFLTIIITLASLVFSQLYILPLLWAAVFVFLILTDPSRALELVFRTLELLLRIVQFIITTIIRILHVLAELIPL